jgi:hypothetical protein
VSAEGRAVLDGVRAARRAQGANAGARFVAWGHSQGGQAALFAGHTQAFARALCQRGEKVVLLPMPGVTHNPAGKEAAPAAVAWIAGRFAGDPMPDDCATLSR